MSVADSLKEYKRKRKFGKTSEPAGAVRRRKRGKPIFVIQKHDARNLHYDLRLEISGVLKSWAVPKGPSTDPSIKRLAIQTEDHPMAYGDFEGEIPEGEYGAGTVIVWDTGTFENPKEGEAKDGRGKKSGESKGQSLEEMLKAGRLEFVLHGKKLRGGYVLIRTRRKAGSQYGGQWLLIKMDDAEADARRNPTSTEPRSVLSGKTIEETGK